MSRRITAITNVCALIGAVAAADTGREAVIDVRETPYPVAPMRSGPYPDGVAEPEQVVDAGVRIAGRIIPLELYEQMKRARYIPMRRELTDEEFIQALRPEAREEIMQGNTIADWSQRKFSRWRPSLFWGFRKPDSGRAINGAENAYNEWFDADGHLRQEKLDPGAPPSVAMMRWGASYWNTGDERWARAVKDAFRPFYQANRPPLEKVLNAKPRTMWHVLSTGSRVPTLIEAYAYVSASKEWSPEDHTIFWKSMLEHARFLRYTTVPVGPWTDFNPFGYGNWLLYQLEGLLAIAAYFPEFAEAKDWLQHARRGIGQHADWSVLPDAGFDEYAMSYAGQVAGQLEYCWNTMCQRNIEPPPRFRDNVLRLHELFLKTSLGEGAQLTFGDTHRGRDSAPARCRWAALAFLDARFLRLAGDADEEFIQEGTKVLHPNDPAEALQRYRKLRTPDTIPESTVLPEPGWAIMRTPRHLGHVELAMAYRASRRVFHSGWEMLGLNLWAEGQPLFVKLLGFKTYMSGYPAGFCRTPRQANIVLLEGEKLVRAPGSLRNWFMSETLDYIHADHAGWGEGKFIARRRVIFVKPDWLVVVDDVQGKGEATLRWQLHTEEDQPRIEGAGATITRGTQTVRVCLANGQLDTESHRVQGMEKTVHLLTARHSGPLPLRLVAVIRIGGDTEDDQLVAAARRGDAWEGVAFGIAGEPHHLVRLEPSDPETGRFVHYLKAGQTVFAAHDGNEAKPGQTTPDANASKTPWLSRVTGLPVTPSDADLQTIPESDVQAFGYHGRPELAPMGVAGRVSWQTRQPATHWVRYREIGTATWRRELQPGLHKRAWILLPDLAAGKEYEIRAVSAHADGTFAVSPVLRRQAPGSWKPLQWGRSNPASEPE